MPAALFLPLSPLLSKTHAIPERTLDARSRSPREPGRFLSRDRSDMMDTVFEEGAVSRPKGPQPHKDDLEG